MNSLSSLESEDVVLSNLLAYCTGHGVCISPSVSVQRVPGKGLGVYTNKPLQAGEQVMHVPTAALVTTASVPLSFVGRDARKDMPVHALLAAYLAFGLSQGKREDRARWTATWPRLSDFTWTLPMFWPQGLREPVGAGASNVHGEQQFLCLPPSLVGSWSPGTYTEEPSTKLVDVQLTKLAAHLEAVAKAFPVQAQSLLSPLDPLHWSFVYAWNAVTSRCFYYLRAGQRPPKDSNEAMALCPGMDLFNHTDDSGCRTTYDKKGYYVSTDREYDEGEEVLLSYGPHSNDTLWTDYGFTMDENKFDGVRLDDVILPTLTDAETTMLEEVGYLGDYWLKPGGVCWRTEVVSWLGILSSSQWHQLVDGTLDPEDADKKGLLNDNVKRKRADSLDEQERLTVRGKRKLAAWIQEIARQAESSLTGLTSLLEEMNRRQSEQGNSTGRLVSLFADDMKTLEAQGIQQSEMQATRTSQAGLRHSMCVQRWTQIQNLCTDATSTMQEAYPALQSEEKEANETQRRKDVRARPLVDDKAEREQ